MKLALPILLMMASVGEAHATRYDCVSAGGGNCTDQIPDGFGSVVTAFEVPSDVCAAGETLSVIELYFDVMHTQPGDLVVTLEHEGTTVVTTDESCCDGDRWAPKISDTPGAVSGCPPARQSLEPLAAFASTTPSGTWTLTIQDMRRGELGALVNWSLELSCTPLVVEPDPSPEPVPETIEPAPDPDPEPGPEANPEPGPEPTAEPGPEAEPGPTRFHVHGSGCAGGDPSSLLMCLLSLIGMLGFAKRSHAQEPVEVRYHAPVPGGDENLVNVHGAETLQHLRYAFGAYLDYAVDPLVLTIEGDEPRDVALISDELRVDVLAAIGFFEMLELGVALPIVLTWSGHSPDGVDPDSSTHVGDLRLIPKWRILDGRFALALAVPVSLPTAGSDFSGLGGPTFEPRLIGELRLGAARVLANVGYRVQPEGATLYDLELGNELRLALGADVEVVRGLHLIGEGIVKVLTDNEAPGELAIGARYGAAGHAVTALAGFGIGDGYGTPAWHITLGYTFTAARPTDRDHDGVFDYDDACIDDPEDKDGFRDDDGCPDPDNDDDGLLDAADKCPTKAEDKDGRDDLDGCPDDDDDGDGIADRDDGPKDERGFGSCKDATEDKDGFDDKDGCPDPDNDQDGVLDIVDGPKDPNDPSGLGSCRDRAETMNGYLDEDGCPDVKKAAIGDKNIDLYETVLFETGKDTLLSESSDLLDQIAAILRDHPEILKLEVAGHTDEVSGEAFNQRLSEKRASAVRDFLIGKGIAADRLVAKGYGERQPLSKETTPEARQKNRRVEFRILQKK